MLERQAAGWGVTVSVQAMKGEEFLEKAARRDSM
jgi:hypothetical protein